MPAIQGSQPSHLWSRPTMQWMLGYQHSLDADAAFAASQGVRHGEDAGKLILYQPKGLPGHCKTARRRHWFAGPRETRKPELSLVLIFACKDRRNTTGWPCKSID